MNIWENAVITNKGLAMLSKLLEGNTLDITRAVTGSGYVMPGNLQSQESVTDIKQTLAFTDVKYPEVHKCALTCRLTNEEVTTGYTAMQVGIYANDPDEGEILFFLAQSVADKGTTVPAYTEMVAYTAEWTFYFQFGLADGVTVVVDPAKAVSVAQMQAYVEEKIAEYDSNEILSASNDDIDAAYSEANA